MTPEQQRIAIAEACGWKRDDSLFTRSQGWRGPQGQWYSPLPPDYLNDLNAMHEAEKVLMDYCDGWEDYCHKIKRHFVTSDGAIRATAAQRAEAFLKTLNLWKP